MASKRETKDFTFEVKEVGDAGQFTGYASVYGIVDDQNDVVEAGAFTKTMRERPEVPILWRHDHNEIIGKGTLVDSESGLIVNGQLSLGLQSAKDAYTRLKDGLVKGLSIGYKAIAPVMSKGKRMLREIKLYEVSLVPFPSNDLALVMSVKEDDPPADSPDEAKEFLDALDMIEQKAGRMISAANRSQIEQCITLLKSLIAPDDTSTPDKGTAKGVSDEPTRKDGIGPEQFHSMLEQFKSNFRRSL
jgi:HK97 family phage prohead protease